MGSLNDIKEEKEVKVVEENEEMNAGDAGAGNAEAGNDEGLLKESPMTKKDAKSGAIVRVLSRIETNKPEVLKNDGCVLATKVCTYALGYTIPLLSVILGGYYVDDCPANHLIPIYLIVGGSFGLVMSISKSLDAMRDYQTENKRSEKKETKDSSLFGFISFFLFIWFILGNVWVFKLFKPLTYEMGSADYCNYNLYWFAFWSIVLVHVSYILTIFLGCVVLCCCGIIGAADAALSEA